MHWKPVVHVPYTPTQHGPYTGISYNWDNYYKRTPQPSVPETAQTILELPSKAHSKGYRASRGHALQRLGNLVRGEPGAPLLMSSARTSIDAYQIVPEELETFLDFAYSMRTKARVDNSPVPSLSEILAILGATSLIDAVQATAVLEEVEERADYAADLLTQDEPLAQIHHGDC
jgi:hypothetical protein